MIPATRTTATFVNAALLATPRSIAARSFCTRPSQLTPSLASQSRSSISFSTSFIPCSATFHKIRSVSRRPFSGSPSMVVASKSVPGVLDTDEHGSVLMAPRDGSVTVSYGPPLSSYVGELLVFGVWAPEDDEADFELPSAIAEFDKSVADGALTEAIADAEFKAKPGSSTPAVRLAGAKAKRVALYGLGKASKGASTVSGLSKFAMSTGAGIKACTTASIYMEEYRAEDIAAAAEGAIVGAFVDERYKEKKEGSKMPTTLEMVATSQSPENDAAIARGRAMAVGIVTTKELVAAPANVLTPATLAIAAETVAKECGLDCKVMGREECEALGMGSYLSVGRGSTDEPKFIHMIYKPADGVVKKKVCMVGKAVTFDTGGTNLKTGGSMIEMMKFDMGGSAVCIGSAKVIGEIKPKNVEVHFIMPAVENMLSDKATHPGDVVKASNGKTVEVINTDAEGRLCLADALVYAENLGDVDYIVDLATLTGAILVSLGADVAGMWSPSDEFAEELLACAKDSGEMMWRQPLVEEYTEQLKSKIADLRNIGTNRFGGSIIAALFLKEFVNTKNWAHIDIAGTVWSEKKGGATGYGVKTMVNWVEAVGTKE